MEYLEDTEEARLMASEMMINNTVTGEFMDPEGEQELDDNRLDTIETIGEFEHLDTEFVDKPTDVFESQFRPITTRPLKELCKQAQKLDFFQRQVVQIGIKYARDIVKARVVKNPIPQAPLVMVDRAAGSGKSTTINTRLGCFNVTTKLIVC